MLDAIPDYKIGYVLAYVQGVAADEEADDIFCQRMAENYMNAPDEDGLLRLRVGGYRIIYSVDNGKLIVYVIDIDNRGDVYKRY